MLQQCQNNAEQNSIKLGIFSTRRSFPNSCSLVVMAIHWLQNCNQPVFSPVDIAQLRLPEAAATKLGRAVLMGQAADTAAWPINNHLTIQRTGNPCPSVVKMITSFFHFIGQFGCYETPIVIDLTSRWEERAMEFVAPEEWDGDAEGEQIAESNSWPRTDVVRIKNPSNPSENLAVAVPYWHWLAVSKAFEIMADKLAKSTVDIKYTKLSSTPYQPVSDTVPN